ncbi:DNA-processing protein DprA [Nocardia alni]|uniref:DNA-processing protein DprA n=1 Tax=Nocardia alni TaxID=2815723 RepID=UPI001C22CEB7|nr:DNA-processing protein DprA [Nocardia alni]
MSVARILAWAVLARAAHRPNLSLQHFIDQVGLVDAAEAIASGDVPPGLAALLASATLETAQRDLDLLIRLGGRLLTPDDHDWPFAASPLHLSSQRGRPKVDHGAPPVLWVRGTHPVRAAAQGAIAVLGSAASTPYGDQVAAEIAGDMARRGYPIVSTAGFGIRAAAVRAVLDCAGAPLVVQPAGLDRPHPFQHQMLLDDVAEVGCVVTAFPPQSLVSQKGLRYTRWLSAALSSAVVFVEAGFRGCTLGTASHARELGRPVFAIPGPVTSPASRGTNNLIRCGAATLATSAAEIIAMLPA